MYTPRFNLVDDEAEIRRMVAEARVAWLVTAGADGVPQATLLPIIWRAAPAAAGTEAGAAAHGTVIAHLARANRHWRAIAQGSPALLIVTGPDAYIHPGWYATKAETGKVVPTWNYSAVHLSGPITVHDDPEWLRAAVTELTETHEAGRPDEWAVADAPADYVEMQLSGIVGIEVAVERVEGKAKLSQNRSEEDRRGVVAGLEHEPFPGADAVASAMEAGL
ncbi:FMN-binding negative transcriptional regulator [Gryllotalpicola protaetiae]|uniref:FMN-binding negative transcriptional regulator n=1 Tax=Gryllotalpicola protaetiae TaxID=2419771 RepID=A0A387BE44_9MICO|nr:FMN-binding negative transcriptional regulator [Gryllotalpicola protaetiae]AYG02235.1 FMN-binding negative transcriptional regulator [Gryllotalpicola protaetiae]